MGKENPHQVAATQMYGLGDSRPCRRTLSLSTEGLRTTGERGVMRGVILAAGDGTRLAPLTADRPKPLVPVLGRPLLDYTLEAFAQAGIKEIGLVVGYRGWMLAAYLRSTHRYGMRVRCLLNSDYKRGNGSSIYAAREFAGKEPFVVAMADHLISADILEKLLSATMGGATLCVDHQAHTPPQLDDATRVWVDERGFILRIGKTLDRWNGVDAGVFRFQSTIFPLLARLMADETRPCTVTRAVRRLIASQEGLRGCDISGCFWLDVDTPADLAYAQQALRRRMAEAIPGQDRVAG
jgi:choline kinase